MGAKYFIVVTGEPKKPDTEVIGVFAFDKKEAYEAAAKEFRAKRNLASSIHISTESVAEFNTEEEAKRYIRRLGELMESHDHTKPVQ